MKTVTKYVASDGTEFEKPELCTAYEADQKRLTEGKYKEYLNTYAGKRLLETYSLSQCGIWRVRGEDKNADLGGYHYQPELGLFWGELGKVIKYCVTLPSFWTWGGGGSFDLVKINEIR